jgi:hypothetical protein
MAKARTDLQTTLLMSLLSVLYFGSMAFLIVICLLKEEFSAVGFLIAFGLILVIFAHCLYDCVWKRVLCNYCKVHDHNCVCVCIECIDCHDCQSRDEAVGKDAAAARRQD